MNAREVLRGAWGAAILMMAMFILMGLVFKPATSSQGVASLTAHAVTHGKVAAVADSVAHVQRDVDSIKGWTRP